MKRWFVVNLAQPRLSRVVEARDSLRAVALADPMRREDALGARAAELEGSYTMAAAPWAVWPADDLDAIPMLVRGKRS